MSYRRATEAELLAGNVPATVHLEDGTVVKPEASFVSDHGITIHAVRSGENGIALCFVSDGFPCRALVWLPVDLLKAMGCRL